MAAQLIRIGIDPDVDKSGYCELSKEPFKVKWKIEYLGCLEFFDIIENLKAVKNMSINNPDIKVLVCIEAGWLNKSIHHIMKGNAHAAKIGSHVGANHQIGRLIEGYCKKIELPYQLYKPATSKWDARLFKKITGWEKNSNAEMRDAVRCAWN